MILTCPNCATRFFIDEEAIGGVGRRVKCDACGAVWTGPPAQPARSGSGTTLDAPADASRAVPVAGPREPPDAGSASSPLFVERPPAKRDVRQRGAGRPWALGAVILVLIVAVGMVVFRSAVEGTFPGAISFYRSLGLESAAASRA